MAYKTAGIISLSKCTHNNVHVARTKTGAHHKADGGQLTRDTVPATPNDHQRANAGTAMSEYPAPM